MTSERDPYGEDLDPPIDDDPNARLLWPGDNGNIPFIAREACVVLMRRTHIWSGASKRSALLSQAAMDHQDPINSWLNAVFLELHLDERNEIAYKLQADRAGGQPFPTLLYDTSYNRDEIELCCTFVVQCSVLPGRRTVRRRDTRGQRCRDGGRGAKTRPPARAVLPVPSRS